MRIAGEIAGHPRGVLARDLCLRVYDVRLRSIVSETHFWNFRDVDYIILRVTVARYTVFVCLPSSGP